jgi:PAS domain S-box-containing protein
MEQPLPSQRPQFVRTRRTCGVAAVALGIISLLGWVTPWRELTNLGIPSVPMAANTALGFILLGIALCVLSFPSIPPWAIWFVRLSAVLVTLVASLRLVEAIPGVNLGIDYWFFQLPGDVNGQDTLNRMAHQTAIAFLCGSLVLLLHGLRHLSGFSILAGCLAVVVLSLGLIFLLGYLFGAPLFAGPDTIYMAWNTALGFVLLGVGLAATLGRDFEPLRQLLGPTIDARLLRAFLPATALTVCLVAWLMHLVSHRQTISSAALLAAVLVVASLFLVSLICTRIARSVGGELEQSEQRSREYAARLQALNTALEQRVAERTAALEQSRDRLDQFFSITTSLTNPDNVDRTLELALGFCQRLGYDRALLSLVDQPAGVIRAVKAAGSMADIVSHTVRPLDGDDILAVVVRDGRTAVIPDCTHDSRCDQKTVAAAGIRGMIVLPLISGDSVVGTLQVGSREPLQPTEDEVRTLETLAAQAARALSRQLRVKEIHRLNLQLAERNQQLQELADDLAATALAERQAREALRESEERTRRIVDTAHDAFVAMDSQGRIINWNPQAEATFGWSRTEAVGQLVETTIIPPQYRAAHREGLKRFLATGDGPVLNRRIELTALRQDGHQFPVEVTIAPVPWGDGYVFSCFLHDITERKQAEEALRHMVASERRAHQELKKAQSQLVQSEKLAALGQLVAGVAHEINNPLSYVSNNVAVLQRDVRALRELLTVYQQAAPLLEQQRPELHARACELAEAMDLAYTLENLEGLMLRSRDGLKRIQQIVKDLRDFARLDESDLHEIDLNAGIESTINIIRGQAKKQQVALELDLRPIPGVTCYPAKINQVVLNLVANALDACSPGGKVTVGTRPEGEKVEIFVADTGTGIDPAIGERIFDPFFTTKPQGKGTGLGLSISYGIVQAHKGTIDFESTLGQGTRFRVLLPRKPV